MNEKVIWDCLIKMVGNAYGTAAIMGNLMAESSLNPACATGRNKTANYVSDADRGAVDFEHDGVAFGLVQWCYKTRKAGLLGYAKSTGRSVGHLQMQLEYLVKEMSESYKTAWKAVTEAKNIREASDIVMLKYEKPATTTEAAKQKRAAYGQKYFDQFADKPEPQPQPQPKPEPYGTKTVRAKDQVNLRSGPGKTFRKVGEMKEGQTLELIESGSGWHKVAVWVMGEFVDVMQ